MTGHMTSHDGSHDITCRSHDPTCSELRGGAGGEARLRRGGGGSSVARPWVPAGPRGCGLRAPAVPWPPAGSRLHLQALGKRRREEGDILSQTLSTLICRPYTLSLQHTPTQTPESAVSALGMNTQSLPLATFVTKHCIHVRPLCTRT